MQFSRFIYTCLFVTMLQIYEFFVNKKIFTYFSGFIAKYYKLC